ncbi:MAG: glycosyltransferase [Sporocytophaga sp.]|uniref:glycosyltransferase n=1 Tax=Sporocytophaga sp. TaxID=2231183 RepID=UPI001B2ACB86|nr:glycosyltransferase [Sporocytophaga sp.]MBO9701189.1 glycosyltransferase [Sporocytophaga sp.]
MKILLAVLLIYFLIYFIYILFLFVFFERLKPYISNPPLSDKPLVSVLVAARNEEDNIGECLKALASMDYPEDKFEVLIGNDRSEDNTRSIILEFIKTHKKFKLLDITENVGQAKGKANVLAQLARKANGEYLFITDADISIPENWVKEMLGNYKKSSGTVSGVTMIKGETLFAKLQSMEWMHAFGMVKAVSDQNIPVSAVGNNMMIPRRVYEETGGYENIPFSVTEDFELFKATLDLGYDYQQLMGPGVLAFSKPLDSLKRLLNQRRRWMHGAVKIPVVLSTLLLLQSLFFPVILVTMFIVPNFATLVWSGKLLLQYSFINRVYKKLDYKFPLWKYIVIYEFYTGFVSLLTLLYYLKPGKIEWKGRRF